MGFFSFVVRLGLLTRVESVSWKAHADSESIVRIYGRDYTKGTRSEVLVQRIHCRYNTEGRTVDMLGTFLFSGNLWMNHFESLYAHAHKFELSRQAANRTAV